MGLSVRLRMILGAALLVSLVAIGSAALCTWVAEVAMTAQFSDTMRSLSENLARNAAHGVFVESGDSLADLADHLMDENEVVAVNIYNSNGELILGAGPKEHDGNLGLVPAPVYFDATAEEIVGPVSAPPSVDTPKIIGRVEVTYSRATLEADLSAVRTRVWIVAALAALAGIFGAALLATRIVRPLRALTRATESIAAGNLNTRVEGRPGGPGRNELARLALDFNRMAESLAKNEEELKRTYEALGRKERLATLGEFTAVIAHELRNPLGIILSSAQVVSNPDRPPEMKEKAAHFIVDEVRRLNEDLTAFLNFAKPKPADPRPVDPDKLLSHAADVFRQRTLRPSGEAPTGGDRVKVEVVANGTVPHVLADPDQIHQALLNLLFNAAQALGANGGTISLSSSSSDGAVEMYVDDDGPGISEEAQSRLFEPFFTTKKKGTGLGLAVVTQILQAHNGSIKAEPSPNGGARFVVRLPLVHE